MGLPVKSVDIYAGFGKERFNKLRKTFRKLKPKDVRKLARTDKPKLDRILAIANKSYALFTELIDVSWNTKIIPDTHIDMYGSYDAMRRGEFTKLVNVVYRGYGKSAIKKNVTIRDILNRDERYIVFVNETIKQSSADSASIKYELRNNEMIKLLYGDVSYAREEGGKRSSVYNVNRTIFYLNNDPTKWVALEVYGMTTAVRGLIVNGIRPTRLILDDFESEKNSSTPAGRETVKDKIQLQFLPFGQAGEFTIVFQGTVVHPKAWLAKIQKDNKDARISSFNNENTYYNERSMSSDPDTYGVGVWPELHGYAFWKEQRDMYLEDNDYWKFLQEYYNIPRQASSPAFNIDMITPNNLTYRSLGKIQWMEDEQGLKIPCKTFIGLDPAYAFTSRADDTVVTVIAVMPGGRVAIIDMYVGKIDMTDKLEKIFEFNKTYQPTNILIEAFGAALELPHSLEREMYTRKVVIPYETFKERIGKSTKFLSGLTPFINRGDFTYTHSCPNIELLLFQMSVFSGEERFHDDAIDGLFLAYRASEEVADIDVEKLILAYKIKHANKINRNPYDAFMNDMKHNDKPTIRSWRR